ncbi:MAG: ATP-grasp domain-containing protein [Acidobacteriota bacterium]|nr:ATP-grasp domain-containing protein [Acidobacteriota bacterium]
MNPQLNVGIVFNAYEPVTGRSDEKLSEESVADVARDVSEAVKTLGHAVSIVPLQRSFLNFLIRIRELNLDVLINLCEGFYGRPQWESNVAAALELMHLTFTGNDSRTLTVCQDKHMAKAILSSHNLPTAASQLISSPEQIMDFRFPVIVKPNSEDASLGISPQSVVFDLESLAVQVKKILDSYKQPALVEEYIDGREFNVAVLENQKLDALPVSEIDFSQVPESMPHICSYEAKWLRDHVLYQTTPPVCPAPIDNSLRDKLQGAAVAAFQAMGCRDYARVDFRMDKSGNIFVLEVNPNPDISLDAGYARALGAAGIDYPSFWSGMLGNALERKKHYDSLNGKAR